jgi:hypothetical protein
MLVTPLGIVTLVRLEQNPNAAPPIVVTFVPMLTLLRLVHL